MHEQKIYNRFDQILEAKNRFKIVGLGSEERKQFFLIFNYCLNSLKDEYRTILNKTYFERDYEYWWLDYYCKSSYYRKRHWAIIAFVRLFELIYENVNDYSFNLNYSN